MAKERTSTYRAAKLLNTTAACVRYTHKARAVMLLMGCEKRSAFRSFCDELQNTQLMQSQAIMKRFVKAKRKYVIHHQPHGKALNQREYTLSLSEKSRAPRPIL